MKRSKHSLSNYKLLSANMGQLVPIGLSEVLPGDSIQQNTNLFVRVAPMVAPVMHPVDVRIHHWFVPTRLIWSDFEKFITGGPDGMDASVPPTFTTVSSVQGQLADYLGITPSSNSQTYSALPMRAYAKIFNEFYRDQDLTTAVPLSTASGTDITTYNGALLNCAWEKDYFTTARPWAHKGPDIVIPLEGTADVTRDSNAASWKAKNAGLDTNAADGDMFVVGGAGDISNSVNGISLDPMGGLSVVLDGENTASINSLREAFALQRYQEARARYGSRYTEYLRYLGIRSSDARLQLPEYLGGGKQRLQFSEVVQTSPGNTDDPSNETPLGTLGGHGIGAARSNRFRRFFEEHGYVLTLMSVRPKTIYTQGMPRMFSRLTKEDWFQKELQHIGQQQILNKEIYNDHTSPNGVFGYQDRYDEYRRQESTVAGEFRDQLDYWHMARIFSADPTLNSAFVISNPTDRIYASTTTDQLYIMANHSIQARRMVASSGGNSYVY